MCVQLPINKRKFMHDENLAFSDLNLSQPVMQALNDLGFTHCSPIQGKSLPFTLRGHDVLGKGQTGTGKTAAFLIAAIEDLLKNPASDERYSGEARVLIIAPTRELVMQIAKDAVALTKHTALNVHALVGGMDFAKQQKKIDSNYVDILVATPGRLLDFCERKSVFLDQVEMLVIDEADRMLDMGFIPQVKRIVRMLPQNSYRQTLLFSATFSEDVIRLSDQWMHEPVRVSIEPKSVATDTVEQKVYMVSGDEKFTLLGNLLQADNVENIIIFANRRDQCRDLQLKLKKWGYKVGLLSGEVPQNKRVRTLEDFRAGKLMALVATDVAGRGIHIDDVSHVVNYTLPDEPEDYVHRIGRTGRAGSKGISISFACEDDSLLIEPIQKLLGGTLQCELPPEELLVPLNK